MFFSLQSIFFSPISSEIQPDTLFLKSEIDFLKSLDVPRHQEYVCEIDHGEAARFFIQYGQGEKG